MTKRDVIHITLPADLPQPIEAMEAATKAFAKAVFDPTENVVITQAGVKCKVHTLEEGEHIRIVPVDPDAASNVITEYLKFENGVAAISSCDNTELKKVEVQP